MCGIAGFLNLDGRPADPGLAAAMCAAIVSRGPDDQGLHADGPMAFGMRRLSIIDLAGGHQPIFNEDRSLAIVFNGEVYNHRGLRQELEAKGHVFATRTDTEAILHLYEDLGPACLERLEGMFALAVWDARARSLFLARDRTGKKPLFYARTGQSFVFGSEPKALLRHPDVSREPDRPQLHAYLFYGFVPAPATAFRDIRQLPPGSWMRVDADGSVTEREYWFPSYAPAAPLPEAQAVDRLLALLREAVARRLESDVPLGAFLSGGVDSSLVVACMRDVAGPEAVHAFTIGFAENAFDESVYAQAAARALGLRHHHVRVFSHADCLALAPAVLEYMDAPMADPSILPTTLLARFTREHVTVALSGDGGDELFAGYPKYLAHRLADRLNRLPGAAALARALAGPAERLAGPRAGRFLRHLPLPAEVRTFAWIAAFTPEEIAELLGEPFPERGLADLARHHARTLGADPLRRMLHLDFALTFPDLYLVKSDRASMSSSLEVRCPMLDGALMAFARGLPPTALLRGRETKHLLKAAAARLLPREIIYRRKMGFGIPLARWLRGGLAPLVDEHLGEERVRRAGVLAWPAVARIRAELAHGRDDRAGAVWSLLVLQHWLDRHAGGAG